ncbi:BglG family transcription antiterminator [Exiguobacterium sp. Helios]|uniref:BglG family transcription antiterminator n=1 Tax=Exiguobacterium sp. Helios TaxID=2735868 RepID=UPI00104B2CE4|nr:BglG family transcription antiterminator [Exiguobacterium sp. Helios]QNR21316.1 BglG family transcription antiterminator [Exiguobacterium sp. Helios]
MIDFTAREREILFYLLTKSEPVQIQEIAEALETSERTIQRERERLGQTVAPFQLEMSYIRGRGLQLSGDEGHKRELREALLLSHRQLPSAEDRQVELAYRLLQEEGMIKLQALAHAMYIAPSTISQDLEQVDEWFCQYALELKRKKGLGAEVIGEEIDKRRLLVSLIFTQWDVLSFYRFLQGHVDQLPHLLQIHQREWIEAINQSYAVIVPLTKQQDISDRLLMRAALSLAVQAIRMDRFPMVYELKAYPLEVLHHVDTLQQRLPYPLSIAERQWISEELRNFQQDQLETGEELVIRLRVKRLIEQVSLLYGEAFMEDRALEHGLVSHIMSYTKQNIVNPSYVIKQIEREYPRLFDAVKQAAEFVFNDQTFADYDLAFWVMHFGAVLSKPLPKIPYRVLVVCSAGLGSSKLLMNRLRQEFTELEQVESSSLFGIGRLQLKDYDFVLSTVPLPDISQPHLLVNPLLPKEEVERIRKLLVSLPKSFQAAPRQESSGWLDLSRLEELVKTARQLSDAFSIETISAQTEGLEEILLEISNGLVDKNVTSSAVQLSTQLLRRHEMSGLGIPGTRLALFHGRDDSIHRGGFFIYELEQPIELLGMDQAIQPVERILVLAAPEEATDQLLQLLSSISGAIIENDVQTHQFEYGDVHQLRQILNRTFRKVIERELQTVEQPLDFSL